MSIKINTKFQLFCIEGFLEAVSKFKLQSKNNIPPSDATKELKDMELRQRADKLLFLLLLRRFHVPAQKHERIPNHRPERWNVVTIRYFETVPIPIKAVRSLSS